MPLRHLQTARLRLFPFADGDAAALLALFRDPHVRRYLLDDVLVGMEWLSEEIRASHERFARSGLGLFAARARVDGALVGFAGLRPFHEPPESQLIYGLAPSYVGQGLATEMARAVVDAAFLHAGFPAVCADIDVPNVASGRVLARLGFAPRDRAPDPQHAQLRFTLPRERYRPGVRPASPADGAAVRTIQEAAFGRPDEAALVEALDAGRHVVASLVATVGDEPIGHILFTELPLLGVGSDRRVRGVALAPLAVSPEVQRRGVGSALIEAGLAACRAAGAEAAVVLGAPAYYRRFGFSAERAAAIRAPWSGPAFMALELIPGALDSGETMAVYAPPFLGERSHEGGRAHEHDG